MKPREDFCAHCSYPIGLLPSSLCVLCDKVIHLNKRCEELYRHK